MNVFRSIGAALATRTRAFAGTQNRAAALLVAAGFILTLLAILGTHFIAREVMARETERFDEALLRDMDALKGSLGAYRGLVDAVFNDLTALGGAPVLGLFTIVTSLYLALAGRRGEAALTVVVAVGATAANVLLKLHYDRPRPEVFARADVYTSSFPSGHSMMSMAIYLTIGILLARLAPTWSARVFATGSAVAVSALVALSRLYQGVHFPTDVAAGILLGLAWSLSILCAVEVFRRPPEGAK